MKINLFYAFAVIVSLACPLAAQAGNYYQQGMDVGKKLNEAFSLRLKGKQRDNHDNAMFAQLVDQIYTNLSELASRSHRPAEYTEFSKGLNSALRAAHISKMLKSADSSVDQFTRNLIEFEYIGCLLISALAANGPEIRLNDNIKKYLDYIQSELRKGFFFPIFEAVVEKMKKETGLKIDANSCSLCDLQNILAFLPRVIFQLPAKATQLYKLGLNQGKKIDTVFSLLMKGSKASKKEQRVFNELVDDTFAECQAPRARYFNTDLAQNTRELAAGLKNGLNYAHFSKKLTSADQSLGHLARKLLKFEYLGCALAAELYAGMPEIKANVPVDQQNRMMDEFVYQELRKGVIYPIYEAIKSAAIIASAILNS